MAERPPMPPPGARDLTAILLRAEEHDAESVRRTVAAAGYGDLFLRTHPLPPLGLLQVEVLDGNGLPRVDPGLVSALSEGGRRACFLHLNREANQALVHGFQDNQPGEGWLGAPDELDAKLAPLLGRTIEELLAADDGSRRGFGEAASNTEALLRGRQLAIPVGTPTGLGLFSFHDRGAGSRADRVAAVAFDAAEIEQLWRVTPGAELATRLLAAPLQRLGPLGGMRDEVARSLAALGSATPDAGGLRSVIAYELLALAESCLFAGGEAIPFVDERLLPVFSLASSDPVLDDPDEAAELEKAPSVLAALVEVLPFAQPGGAVLDQIADDELAPLAPWVGPGEEYRGSLFRLHPQRLRRLLGSIDGRDLAARVDLFYRAWWKAGHDGPLDDAFASWRASLDERGGEDIARFLSAWAELRTVLEVAAANRLEVALVFYGLGEASDGAALSAGVA